MWIFRNEQRHEQRYCLLAGQNYTVGRLTGEIVIRGDVSVSRNHGLVTVSTDGKSVHVKDTGSSYGIYVGQAAIESSGNCSQADRVPKGQEASVGVGERVRFGLQSTLFKLEKHAMVLCMSSLANVDKMAVRRTATQLGNQSAIVVPNWDERVTHLVMKEVILTIKVANALAKGIPIISPTYLEDYLNCCKTKQMLPDCKDYVPPLKESTLNANEVSLAINRQRATVFKGKSFFFATQEQMDKFQAAVTYGGGTANIITSARNPDIFQLEANILVQPSRVDGTTSSRWTKAMEKAAANEFSPVPESHIGLAILHVHCNIYCNPAYKPKVVATGQTVAKHKPLTLAPESQTQHVAQSSCDPSEETQARFIPETLPPKTQSKITQQRNIEASSSRSESTRVIPETLPSSSGTRSTTRSQSTRVIPSTLPSPSQKSDSSTLASNSPFKSFVKDDDDDLFAFDNDEPPPIQFAKPRSDKRKCDDQVDHSEAFAKRPRLSQEQRVALPSSSKKTVVEGQQKRANQSGDTSAAKKAKIDDQTTIVVADINGFIGKSGSPAGIICKLNDNSQKVPPDELTRSFGTLEIKPLVVQKTGRQNFSRRTNKSNLDTSVNVKRFQKQHVARASRQVVCKKVDTTSVVSIKNGNTTNGFADPMEAQFMERTIQHQREEQEADDFWNFEQSQRAQQRQKPVRGRRR